MSETEFIKEYSLFYGIGAVGYCVSKDEKYLGFKGDLLVSYHHVTKGLSIALANIDERGILPEVVRNLQSDVIS